MRKSFRGKSSGDTSCQRTLSLVAALAFRAHTGTIRRDN